MEKTPLGRGQRRRKTRRSKIPPTIQRALWVAAGGRCSFPGCPIKVDIDPVTLTAVNHGNIAHIVAASEDGPRGGFPMPHADRNQISNLMLLCMTCHELVDDKANVPKYPVELLRKYKTDHENRIEHLTGLPESARTFAVRCRANILSETVQIPFEHIQQACLPRYPQDRQGVEIDLTRAPGDDSQAYWAAKKYEISQRLGQALGPTIDGREVEHLSVFALGPMPLLIFLGCGLSNKIPTDLYQRHRDTETWAWPDDHAPSKFQIERLRAGTDSRKVAVLVMLSGTIHFDRLSADIDDRFTIYAIALRDESPRPTFLRNRATLNSFKIAYREFLSGLGTQHPGLAQIHLFPAVPAPIAVLLGRELLKKVDPTLIVYDFDKNKGGFEFALEVNDGRG